MPTHESSRYTFAQFAAVRRYQLALAVSPDGSEVAYSTNISGQFNLWRQASTGGFSSTTECRLEPAGSGVLPARQRSIAFADRGC